MEQTFPLTFHYIGRAQRLFSQLRLSGVNDAGGKHSIKVNQHGRTSWIQLEKVCAYCIVSTCRRRQTICTCNSNQVLMHGQSKPQHFFQITSMITDLYPKFVLLKIAEFYKPLKQVLLCKLHGTISLLWFYITNTDM